MTHIEQRDLEKLGLIGLAPKKIAHSIEFETPVRLSNIGVLGHEKVGALTYIGPESEIKNATIGRFCSIARNVALGPPEHPVDWVSSHPMQYGGLNWFNGFESWDEMSNPNLRWLGNRAGVKVGHNVWIGRNAVVRQGVTVGDGAIIGANAFVNKDVPPYAIVAGQPAKLIRFRLPEEQISELTKLLWWNWKAPEKEAFAYDDVPKFIETFKKWKTEGKLSEFKPKKWRVFRKGKHLELEEKI